MSLFEMWIAFYTMLRKDIIRIFRIWVQTFLPSVVTSVLYFAVFGSILGSRIGEMQGVDYMDFVVPGLVMLAIVTSAYANSSFTFFQSKFFARSIDEMLVSPMPPWLMIAGFIAGGVVRGIIVGALVMLVSLFFTGLDLTVHNALIILAFATMTALVFALAGLVNGVYKDHRRHQPRTDVRPHPARLPRRHILFGAQFADMVAGHHIRKSSLLSHQWKIGR